MLVHIPVEINVLRRNVSVTDFFKADILIIYGLRGSSNTIYWKTSAWSRVV